MAVVSTSAGVPGVRLGTLSVLVLVISLTVAGITLAVVLKYRHAKAEFQLSEDLFRQSVFVAVSNYLDLAYARQNVFLEKLQERLKERNETPLQEKIKCLSRPYGYWLTPGRRVRVNIEGSEIGLGDICEYGVLVRANEFSLLFRSFDGKYLVVRNSSVIPDTDDAREREREPENALRSGPRSRARAYVHLVKRSIFQQTCGDWQFISTVRGELRFMEMIYS